jgi:Leucine-rich repeat (LRR) protein
MRPQHEQAALDWWDQLEEQWKKAFNETVFQKGPSLDQPAAAELLHLLSTPTLRFAGPRAPYPNMSFELTNLSGLAAMAQLELLVVIYHRISSLDGIEGLRKVKQLFVYNNQLRSLDGIQNKFDLEMLYAQFNQISSLAPLRQLTKLRELYLSENQLSEIDGLNDNHTQHLQGFFVLPNQHLPDREVMRVERELGIRCRRG